MKVEQVREPDHAFSGNVEELNESLFNILPIAFHGLVVFRTVSFDDFSGRIVFVKILTVGEDVLEIRKRE